MVIFAQAGKSAAFLGKDGCPEPGGSGGQLHPTLCTRCKKNVAVIFITKIENNEAKNEGLCLKCAREIGIKPVDDIHIR